MPDNPMIQEFTRLHDIMVRLRGPSGCPWDREQTHATLLKCLIEEAYELSEAVLEADDRKIREELGDVMLQVVFHAVLGRERNAFGMAEICRSIADKLERRHPHVFGDTRVSGSDEVVTNWEKIKRRETGHRDRTSVLDGIPAAMPALQQALKIQKRAAKVGFDWTEAAPILAKVREETAELEAELRDRDPGRMADEIGDLFFSVVNLARHLRLDPEEALARTNRKFSGRFRRMEQRIASDGRDLFAMSLAEMDRYWEEEKGREPGDASVSKGRKE